MTRNLPKATARRTFTTTLAALVLAAALPQAGFAADSNDGAWKVDTARSSFNSGHATLTLTRVGGVNATTGALIVISKGNVYRVMGATASDSKGVKPVDYTSVAGGQSVLIGANARAIDHCGLQCQAGLLDRRLTLRFKAVDGAGRQIDDMLAYEGQKP